MKAMLFADLAILKKYQPQQIVIAILLGVFVGAMTASLTIPLAAVCVSVAYSLAFLLLSLDERNNWERYRLSLPFSRKDVMRGRYASILVVSLEALALGLVPVLLFWVLGALVPGMPVPNNLTTGFEAQGLALVMGASFAIVMVSASIMLPLSARFGITRAVRYVPLAAICLGLLVFACMQVGGTGDESPTLALSLLEFVSSAEGALIAAGAICLAGLALYAASYALSSYFYGKREF